MDQARSPGSRGLSGARGARARATLADPRWRAVAARDRESARAFVFSVRTTGVFCRPACPARTPRPENVRFHADAAAALREGLRPCKRCRPTGPSLAQDQARLVVEACRHVERSERAPRLADLAARAGVSAHHLHRLFLGHLGLTPRAYAAAVRAARARAALRRAPSVTRAMYAAGYASSGRFYAESDGVLGMTPTSYRRGGRGVVLRHASGRCSLGTVLVAVSDRGVCAVLLGDGPDALERDLRERFPGARLEVGGAGLSAALAAVVAAVETPRRGLHLPLDLVGTAFQRRVWEHLRRLPPEGTVTYAQVARALGAPRSARAVAGACAANPLAVAVPCHRVVRGDGGLGGYRWGLARKRLLLAREADPAPRRPPRGAGRSG